jgi:hypothetical protein
MQCAETRNTIAAFVPASVHSFIGALMMMVVECEFRAD